MAAWSLGLPGRQDLLGDQVWRAQRIGGVVGTASTHRTVVCETFANEGAARWNMSSMTFGRTGNSLVKDSSCSEELVWRRYLLDQSSGWHSRQHDKGLYLHEKHFNSAQQAAPVMQMGGLAPSSAGLEMTVRADTVSKLCKQGQLDEAVEALGVLAQTGCHGVKPVLYNLLTKCVGKKDLLLGRRLHALMVEFGYESDTFLCNHVLRMYASHDRLEEAMVVFSAVTNPDRFTWSAMISAYVKHGEAKQAIHLYHQMRGSSVEPDGHVFVAALQACARAGDLKSGQQVHADLLASGVEPGSYVCNGLVDMYAKCSSLGDAQRVFDGLCRKDVVTWTALIAGYSQQGLDQEAFRFYRAMQEEGMAAANSVTFVCLLQACASVGTRGLEKGKQLHAQIGEQGLQADGAVGCSLVNMYAKCGSLKDAQSVFDELPQKPVVTWTALIAGYCQQGMGHKALQLYSMMRLEGIAAPDSVTFVCLLQACASVGTSALETGKDLHQEIEERGLQAEVTVGNNLINMYAKCGSLKDARSVFDGLRKRNVVTWTAMIAGYAQQGMGEEALHLYINMQEEGTAASDSVTFVCLLQACAAVGTPALEMGKRLHAEIGEQGIQVDVVVGCSLVNMYAKCGSLRDAQTVFDSLPEKNVVTWTALIAQYSQQGMSQEAFHLYRAMQEEGIAAHSATFVSLLQACASVAALHTGRQLHEQIKEQGLLADENVGNSLINMYAKSGSMIDAQQVFYSLPERDLVSWNALISGYARQGDSGMVLNLVHMMQEDGVQPDSVTLLNVLTVCSHAGLVNKGQDHFEAMSTHYGITPTMEHYSCMVDLLSRAGQLHKALAVVRTIPVQPHISVWHTLLGASQKWSNVEVGRHAFDEAVKLDEKDASAYVLMANIYSSALMWEEAQEIQERRKIIGAWKEPGQSSWTDGDGLVHTFVVRDKKHPEIEGR